MTKEKAGELDHNQDEIKGYADSSYGGEEDRSQSGSLVTLNGQPVMWNSQRQDTTAQSITEAEYIACAETTKDQGGYNNS